MYVDEYYVQHMHVLCVHSCVLVPARASKSSRISRLSRWFYGRYTAFFYLHAFLVSQPGRAQNPTGSPRGAYTADIADLCPGTVRTTGGQVLF